MKNALMQPIIDFMQSSPNLDRLWPIGILILRVYVGIAVIVGHGLHKLQDMSGGNPEFPDAFIRLGFPFPDLFAWLVTFIQIFVSLLIIFGLWTRPSAILVGFTIAYGVLGIHWFDGYGRMELGITYSVIFAMIAITGPGKVSIDRLIRRES